MRRLIEAAARSQLWIAIGHLGNVQTIVTFGGAVFGVGGAYGAFGAFLGNVDPLARGLMSVGLGIVAFGVLVGLFTWVNGVRRSSDAPRAHLAHLVEPVAVENHSGQARVVELEAQDRRLRQARLLDQIRNELRIADEIIATYGPSGPAGTGESVDDGWSHANAWADRVEKGLADALWSVQADVDAFRRNIDTLLSDVAGRERLVRS